MGILNTAQSYGFISILFHWLMAIILLATFLLGLNLEDNFQNYDAVLMLHNSLGILIFLLAIFRDLLEMDKYTTLNLFLPKKF